MEQSTVTMADVAARARTSTATVSRVLTDSQSVSAKLKRRVLAAVEEMGYAPNPAAKALSRQRQGASTGTGVIAIATCGAAYGHLLGTWAEAMGGMLQLADELGLMITIARITEAELTGSCPPPAISRIAPDGVIIIPQHGVAHEALRMLEPVLMMGFTPQCGCQLPVVEPDFRRGIGSLFQHLLGLGHRRLEYVPQRAHIFPQRLRGEILSGLATSEGIVGSIAAPFENDCNAYVQNFLSRPKASRPTALLAGGDGPANLLRQGFLSAGVRVPQELSIVGFDGFAWARDHLPHVTSWYVDWLDLGRLTLLTLTDLIGGRPAPTRVLAGGHLHLGETTATAP